MMNRNFRYSPLNGDHLQFRKHMGEGETTIPKTHGGGGDWDGKWPKELEALGRVIVLVWGWGVERRRKLFSRFHYHHDVLHHDLAKTGFLI